MTKRVELLFPARVLFESYDEEELRARASEAGYGLPTVKRWIEQDIHFSIWKADIVAIRFGKHPAQVWGDKWLEA